jgi:hypothetical protein
LSSFAAPQSRWPNFSLIRVAISDGSGGLLTSSSRCFAPCSIILLKTLSHEICYCCIDGDTVTAIDIRLEFLFYIATRDEYTQYLCSLYRLCRYSGKEVLLVGFKPMTFDKPGQIMPIIMMYMSFMQALCKLYAS